jgi:ubiquinone/menaquinone biosynthesis C-methylase UbiE
MRQMKLPAVSFPPAGMAQGDEPRGALNCPVCRTSLSQTADFLTCMKCTAQWPVVDGIPYFIDDFPYWGEMPLEQMQEVNRRAASGGWKSALADSQDPLVQRAAVMIRNLERANWHLLFDLPSNSRVLDVGAGTGTNSHAFAMHYGQVVALEPVLERIRFMQQRFRQENLSNVQVIRSTLWTLPFAAASFDLVAMNGVLEWVPAGQSGDPRDLQIEALKNMFRLLRPGGALYVGIENRTCPEYLFGCRDPHCGLPYVTVLPRPLAQWYARAKGRDGYRNYLYSSWGYRKLLREAGFSSVEVFIAVPSYNHPRYLIPMKDNVFSYFWRNFNSLRTGGLRGICNNILLRTGLLKQMNDSFVILARK